MPSNPYSAYDRVDGYDPWIESELSKPAKAYLGTIARNESDLKDIDLTLVPEKIKPEIENYINTILQPKSDKKVSKMPYNKVLYFENIQKVTSYLDVLSIITSGNKITQNHFVNTCDILNIPRNITEHVILSKNDLNDSFNTVLRGIGDYNKSALKRNLGDYLFSNKTEAIKDVIEEMSDENLAGFIGNTMKKHPNITLADEIKKPVDNLESLLKKDPNVLENEFIDGQLVTEKNSLNGIVPDDGIDPIMYLVKIGLTKRYAGKGSELLQTEQIKASNDYKNAMRTHKDKVETYFENVITEIVGDITDLDKAESALKNLTTFYSNKR